MTIKIKRFDIAEHLETEEDIKMFLQEAAKNGNASEFVHALGPAARAKSMTDIANKVGVSRTSLYKSLEEDSNPSFLTVSKVLEAVGCQWSVC